MITPICNYQSNTAFNARLKMNKNFGNKNPKNNIQKVKLEKIKNGWDKLKTEFKNLDQESKMLLYKSIVLLSIITVFLAQVIHVVKMIVDKFNALFE